MHSGNPSVPFLRKSLSERAASVLPSYLATLLPDAYSVAVYFRIRRHVEQQQQQGSQVGKDSSGADAGAEASAAPYGGIYVGEEMSVRSDSGAGGALIHRMFACLDAK